MKKINEKKKGISLIVLIITIIVIIILAVTVILTVSKNNPIENAKKAVFQNDLKTIQEEVNMYEANEYISKSIAGTKYVSTTIYGEEMVAKFSSTKKYKEKIRIVDGKVKLMEGLNEQEVLWAKEIGIEKVASWGELADISWYNEEGTSFNISTAEELAGLAKIVNEGIDTFERKIINLTNDIDLKNIEWIPIGNDYSFCGKFDGKNHAVSNMKITDSSLYSGLNPSALFGCISQFVDCNEEVYIKNLLLKNSKIIEENVGGIVGLVTGNLCYIENCGSINNYIEGSESAAGVVNYLYNSIAKSCYNTSTVVCTYSGTSFSSGSSLGHAGGIEAGCVDGAKIYNCYNIGKVSSPNGLAGGITGACWGYNILNCYNLGTIEGKVSGELVGILGSHDKDLNVWGNQNVIKNCYYLEGKTAFGKQGEVDPEYPDETVVENIISISSENLKLAQAVDNLNQNGYSEYKQDINNINNGYPILKWQ